MKLCQLKQTIKEEVKLIAELNAEEIRSWAVHADIYEKIFSKAKNKVLLNKLYTKLMKKITNPNRRFAVNYFYSYRKNELGIK